VALFGKAFRRTVLLRLFGFRWKTRKSFTGFRMIAGGGDRSCSRE